MNTLKPIKIQSQSRHSGKQACELAMNM